MMTATAYRAFHSLRSRLLLVLALLALQSCGSVSHATTGHPPAPLDSSRIERALWVYADSLAASINPKGRSVLRRIPDKRRRLLALRGYLRRDSLFDSRWSWTAKEISAFRRTKEYRETMEQVVKVKKLFAEMHPGYTLTVNTGVRSLEEQIAKWNSVASIRVSSSEVVDTARIIFAELSLPAVPDSASLAAFRAFLQGYELVNTPTVAVPGFSEHGQLRAFDFKVMRGGRIVAGTQTSTIPLRWDGPGSSKKLRDAVAQASSKFRGPLEDPYEPWHYSYDP